MAFTLNLVDDGEMVVVRLSGFVGLTQAHDLLDAVRDEFTRTNPKSCSVLVELHGMAQVAEGAISQLLALRDLCAFAGCRRVLLRLKGHVCPYNDQGLRTQLAA